MGNLGNWSSLSRHEYCTLKALTDLLEEDHINDDDINKEKDFVNLMLDLALEASSEKSLHTEN